MATPSNTVHRTILILSPRYFGLVHIAFDDAVRNDPLDSVRDTLNPVLDLTPFKVFPALNLCLFPLGPDSQIRRLL